MFCKSLNLVLYIISSFRLFAFYEWLVCWKILFQLILNYLQETTEVIETEVVTETTEITTTTTTTTSTTSGKPPYLCISALTFIYHNLFNLTKLTSFVLFRQLLLLVEPYHHKYFFYNPGTVNAQHWFSRVSRWNGLKTIM